MPSEIKMQITWVKHSEYDESAVHQLYQPMLSSGRGFGAQRVDIFCSGVCASSLCKWGNLVAGNVSEDVRILTRNSINEPGEPDGIVLSAATSFWLPVSRQRIWSRSLRDRDNGTVSLSCVQLLLILMQMRTCYYYKKPGMISQVR
ncbi:hypothetical protein SADUNF_Sadunf12G0109300 [Salix dunnii]|uniref:HD-Zip IV C-terminal domain-containing protein n=1 Tax=Salix dunnii TaxID=1413687 RepID=A0A835MSM7_9ROSI|nr:hypothetical protein SADUNF_Sadunf12G0109300 [Salix dunnii]